jgi:error-prone DNA polymerase
MVHPYLKRRQGLEEISYPHPDIKAVLERTLGIPVFQEQVIRLAMVAAGFSGGEADQLRRAMASWGKNSARNNELLGFQQKLIDGMLARGYSQDFAERLFRQIQGFGVYGFPESHSASFALLAYVSAWLKRHYPAAFYCALLNSQPMGFYTPSQLVQDAQRHQIKVLPIDVLHSQWDHALEGSTHQPALRLGLRLIKGFSSRSAQRITDTDRQFTTIAQLTRGAGLSRAELSLLSSAGALASLSENRRQAHWQALVIDSSPTLLQPPNQESADLQTPSETENLYADYNHTGLSLGRHPMELLREQFPMFRRCKRHAELAALGHRRFVRIAGLVTGKQRPGTASGVVFLTLEDETGNSNVVVWHNVQKNCRQALLKAQLLIVKGVIETDGAVVHVIAQELTDCSELLSRIDSKDSPGVDIKSRNFR